MRNLHYDKGIKLYAKRWAMYLYVFLIVLGFIFNILFSYYSAYQLASAHEGWNNSLASVFNNFPKVWHSTNFLAAFPTYLTSAFLLSDSFYIFIGHLINRVSKHYIWIKSKYIKTYNLEDRFYVYFKNKFQIVKAFAMASGYMATVNITVWTYLSINNVDISWTMTIVWILANILYAILMVTPSIISHFQFTKVEFNY